MVRNWHAHAQRVRVDETPLGKGVFSVRTFRANQVIGVIQGRVIEDPEYGSHYCMDLGGDRSLEPIAPYRFLNHSCDPNAELFSWTYEDDPDHCPTQLFVQALRSIREGEEITIDYAWSADAAIPCLCGSDHCRGFVVSEEELALARRQSEMIRV